MTSMTPRFYIYANGTPTLRGYYDDAKHTEITGLRCLAPEVMGLSQPRTKFPFGSILAYQK